LRADIAVTEVIAKCDVLKRAGIWLPEPHIRPRAWLANFDESDLFVAATLLDRFTFYNNRLTDRLLIASYESISDGMYKGPQAPSRNDLVSSLSSSVFTPVEGERPNPTDSGNLLCRKARQILNVSQREIVSTKEALSHAKNGGTVIFIDDFVGSGDQFLTTWKSPIGNESFEAVQRLSQFVAIYITLVTTDVGFDRINAEAPAVALCATHVLEKKSTVHSYVTANPGLASQIDVFLRKYSQRLQPAEGYIASSDDYRRLGYKMHGLMFGFEHSVPDATLPIFWSKGDSSWEPLIERN
jgi:hypothetical protein